MMALRISLSEVNQFTSRFTFGFNSEPPWLNDLQAKVIRPLKRFINQAGNASAPVAPTFTMLRRSKLGMCTT